MEDKNLSPYNRYEIRKQEIETCSDFKAYMLASTIAICKAEGSNYDHLQKHLDLELTRMMIATKFVLEK